MLSSWRNEMRKPGSNEIKNGAFIKYPKGSTRDEQWGST